MLSNEKDMMCGDEDKDGVIICFGISCSIGYASHGKP